MRDLAAVFLVILIFCIVFFNSTARAIDIRPEKFSQHISLKLYSIAGEKMVSLRELAGYNDWQLDYHGNTDTIIIDNGQGRLELKIAEGSLGDSKLPISPVIVAGRTYISLQTVKLLMDKLEQASRYQLLTALYLPEKWQRKKGEGLSAEIVVLNISSRPLFLRFSSGQRYDLYLQKGGNQRKKVIWRWSEGKFFTMALVRKELKPGEQLNYLVKIPTAKLAEGTYTLGGELATIDRPLPLGERQLEIFSVK